MNLGAELKRDQCPAKYTKKVGIADVLPMTVALLLVSFFSGTMLQSGGVGIVVTVLVEAVFIVGLDLYFIWMMNKSRARLGETYLSVCEGGICGVRAINGYKNGEFSVPYADIKSVTQRGERLTVVTQQGRMIFTLTDAAGTAALIQQKRGE